MTTSAGMTADMPVDVGSARPAPVADWVSIPQLYRDPFPTFERLRAEGGVHWVPAVGRYLVTSYDAVHDTELDQGTFSADEQGSLMIRAMGHSMLRKDDPAHQVERRAWQPVLRPSAVKKAWMPIFHRNAERYLAELRAKGPEADLVWDFAASYVSENLRAITGLHNVTQADLQRWSQTLIDATGNYADDPEVWARGEASFSEVDAALDEMLAWHRKHPDESLISALLAAGQEQMPVESIRANLKMTIGGGLNEPRDAIGVAAWALLRDPEQRALATAGAGNWDAVFDEAIRWVAPIGMYSRQTTRDTVLQGVALPAGAKLGICLLSANRDESQWPHPERFEQRRSGEGAHLAFGKGVHVCLGAWVARAEVAEVALPRLFAELPELRLVPERPAVPGGWVFRGMDEMPVRWGPASASPTVPEAPETAAGPAVAVVGAGPAGCYAAQALRRRLPEARITVLDAAPVPYGLVRTGVAADHQGTKAVASQFATLFERDGVEFVGSTRVRPGAVADVSIHGRPAVGAPELTSQQAEGAELSLSQLRQSHDVVVVATGLHADRELPVPGATLPGVYGSGRITRLLNSCPIEHGRLHDDGAWPELGETAVVIGHGNVAMDVVRLLASSEQALAASDVHAETHRRLRNGLRTLHVVGRSQPEQAKFDPVMLREIVDVPGLRHQVRGVDEAQLARGLAAGDPRCQLVAELREAGESEDREDPDGLKLIWWFGTAPHAVIGTPDQSRVSQLHLSSAEHERLEDSVRLPVDAVITAIGFEAEHGVGTAPLVRVDPEASSTGRVEPGLYVAGWLRRGPVGTIPSQRTDARELAETIAADLESRGVVDASDASGLTPLRAHLARSTTYDGWLMVDARERLESGKTGEHGNRPRTKITDARTLRLIAASATSVPQGQRSAGAASSEGSGKQRTDLPELSILFATESGNGELVAEELAQYLADRFAVTLVDAAQLTGAEDLRTDVPTVVICSTYGDGELPASARPLHAGLAEYAPDLSGLRYAMFGLGDRSYHATYSRGSEILDAALRDRGAQRVGEYGRHDAAGGLLATDVARDWADATVTALTDTQPVTVS
ncbi:cytochrome P450 [Citricoccus muralis]|uniref:Cytochrome P450 n=1 Tax=Citricoccus muralis TaxID=169134 RepID=A0ABY8H6B2_9MICC|nr:cytochrome P450 [Citricoccus muralis]WFP16466.1 cytochrome P450 [Citricoccus muralis]